MGLRFLGSSSTFDDDRSGIKFFSVSSFDKKPGSCDLSTTPVDRNVNPDPGNYKIIKHVKIGSFLVILINYPDCVNYEGNKILVFENVTIMELSKQKLIDPHFTNNTKVYAPIARFEPTDRGWDMAHNFCLFYPR